MIVAIVLIILGLYLCTNLVYTLFNEWCFNSQRGYMSLKELRQYKDMIILTGGGASIKFDYEWGIKFTPLTYWYFIYLVVSSSIMEAKIRKENKISPPWRLK